jgi:N utilization substance protein A
MEKIVDIIDSIAYEKGLKISEVEASLKEALIRTAQKMVDYTLHFDADIDRANKELKLFQKIEVVKDDDPRLQGIALRTDESISKESDKEEDDRDAQYKEEIINPENFISITDANDLDSSLEVGDFLQYDLEFESMGRNAATILNSNFEYKLQKYIEDNIFEKYKEKIGTIINSSVVRVDQNENTIVEIGEVKGILARKSRIKGESFKVGDVMKAVVRSVKIDKSRGLMIELSRTSPKFLEALLELEVPELKDEKIKIEASARIPGARAKIALTTTDPHIDPIGSIVGVKGVRVSAVSAQLDGENIDCVEYSAVPEIFISRALSPAIVNSVKIEKSGNEEERDKAIITLNADQKSRAIGKAGLNIRLASMLTKHDIEIVEIDAVTPGAESQSSSNSTEEDKTKDTSSLEALFK